MSAFGFDQIAYAGPETGVRDRVSYLLEQNKLRFVLTASLRARRRDRPSRDAARRRRERHRDPSRGRPAAFDMAVRGGARVGARAGRTATTPTDKLVKATIATYGETVHSFVQRDGYSGIFAPGFVEARKTLAAAQKPGLQFIDHCVGNVGWGEMDAWGDFYARVFGFSQLVSFDDKDISTEYTALRSKVMTDPRHRVKFPINEPAQGKKKSQIEEYLDFYRGAGVQHMAIRTDDIAATIRALKANGVEFLDTPDSYYDAARRSASERSTRPWRRCASCASSSIATTWATCSRSSPSRCRTARRSSSRSFSARAACRSARELQGALRLDRARARKARHAVATTPAPDSFRRSSDGIATTASVRRRSSRWSPARRSTSARSRCAIRSRFTKGTSRHSVFLTLNERGLGEAPLDPRSSGCSNAASIPATLDDARRHDPGAWPSRASVAAFAARCDAAVERALMSARIEDPGVPRLVRAQAAYTILEHELMHQETLLYIVHQLAAGRKRAIAGAHERPCDRAELASQRRGGPGDARRGARRARRSAGTTSSSAWRSTVAALRHRAVSGHQRGLAASSSPQGGPVPQFWTERDGALVPAPALAKRSRCRRRGPST